MTEFSDFDRLMEKARNCRNNAKAERAVYEAFRSEYVAGLSNAENPPTPEMYRHTRETYDFYVGGQNRERAFLKDAELFERVAAILSKAHPNQIPNINERGRE